jgi:hypothetical protein
LALTPNLAGGPGYSCQRQRSLKAAMEQRPSLTQRTGLSLRAWYQLLERGIGAGHQSVTRDHLSRFLNEKPNSKSRVDRDDRQFQAISSRPRTPPNRVPSEIIQVFALGSNLHVGSPDDEAVLQRDHDSDLRHESLRGRTLPRGLSSPASCTKSCSIRVHQSFRVVGRVCQSDANTHGQLLNRTLWS